MTVTNILFCLIGSGPQWSRQSAIESGDNAQYSVFLSLYLLLSLFLPLQKGRSYFSPHLPRICPTNNLQTNMSAHCPFHSTTIFFPPPPLPCSHPLWTTGESTCTPHSPPTTSIVSHFCPLTIWQLCFTKLTSSAVYNCLPLIWLPFTYLQ